jgi:hypothetical protein
VSVEAEAAARGLSVEELLWLELHALQHPPDCGQARLLLAWPLNAGAGAHFSLLAAKLSAAYATNR